MATIPPLSLYFKAEFGLSNATECDVMFQEASGMSRELDMETIKEGGENRFSHKLPGRASYPNLILKRGLMTNTALRDWFHSAIYELDILPITIWLKLLDPSGEPLLTHTFHKAWPKKWSITDYNSKNSEISIESLEICYQYFSITE